MVAVTLMSLQGQYRTTLYDQWVKQLTIHHVPHTSKPTLIATLGNPVKIRSWQVTIRRWQGVLPAGPRASCLLPTPLSQAQLVDASSQPS